MEPPFELSDSHRSSDDRVHYSAEQILPADQVGRTRRDILGDHRRGSAGSGIYCLDF